MIKRDATHYQRSHEGDACFRMGVSVLRAIDRGYNSSYGDLWSEVYDWYWGMLQW